MSIATTMQKHCTQVNKEPPTHHHPSTHTVCALELPLTELANRCAAETNKYRAGQPYDTRYGFELFRRTFQQQDAAAQEIFYQQYLRQVTAWVECHPRFPRHVEDADFFVNGVFMRLWAYLTPEKFAKFTELGALLNYVRMCVNSELEEYWRQQAALRFHEPLATAGEAGEAEGAGTQLVAQAAQPDEIALQEEFSGQLWQSLRERLHTDQEALVVYASFVLDLKPRQIYAAYPTEFRDVKEIHYVKANLVERLRRDKGLQQLMAQLR